MLCATDGKEMLREGTVGHWELYRRACRERPDLVREVEQAITIAINDELARQKIVNSSRLGARVLDTLPTRAE